MAENIFTSLNYSAQGMTVQRMRLSAVAKNIANANSTRGTDGEYYKREVVKVREYKPSNFDSALNTELAMTSTDGSHYDTINNSNAEQRNKILEAEVQKDPSAARLVYDPAHPDADEKGYVKMPNVNVVTEMVEMISAQRAFEANANVIEAAKNYARDVMEI